MLVLAALLACLPQSLDAAETRSFEPDAESRSAAAANAIAPRFFWADYDGDGLLDAFIVAPEGGASLLRNLGQVDFDDVTLAVGLATFGDEAHQGAWADYNGDGRLDLFIASYTGPSHLLRQTAAGSFEDVTALSGLPALARVLDVTWFDQDGDSRPDLFLTTLEGVRLFRNSAGIFGEVGFNGEGVKLARIPADQIPATVQQARLLRGLPAPTSTLPDTAPASSSSGPPVCADRIIDLAHDGGCVAASRVPTLGLLMPLNAFFNVTPSGDVGIGTTTPSAKLEVNGMAKMSAFQLTTGAASGAVLTSNATGQGTWTTAPVGATGPTGPMGVAGATGATGAMGLPGATGATGTAGANGTPGPAGPTGVTGAMGATGAMGLPGPTGATGTAGTNGSPGPAGPTGPTGASGSGGGSVIGGSGPNLFPSETRFLGTFAYTNLTATDEDEAQVPMPVAGTLSNFRVKVTEAFPSGQITFTVRKNGADTAVSCIVTSGGTTCTSASSVTFAAGDLLSLEYTSTATGANIDGASWSAVFTSP